MKASEWLIVALVVWLIWAGLGGGGIVPLPPAPIPGDGLRMLIVEETADRGKLPRPQAAILQSTRIREYLNSHCAKGADGKTPEWRQLDDDFTADQLKFEQPNFVKAYADAKTASGGKTPWLVISNGSSGVSTPLPATEDEVLAELKNYGGP